MTALEVFTQKNGEVTKAYYAKLEERGPIGLIAVNLFRAQKRSTAAKSYRGRRYKSAAYDVKNWSIEQLCLILTEHGASRGITWGWKEGPNTPGFEWVLYVDLPQGQCSFHSAARGQGPGYAGDWDRQRKSEERILAFCDNVLNLKPIAMEADHVPSSPSEPGAPQIQVGSKGPGGRSRSLHDGGSDGKELGRADEHKRLDQYRLPGCDDRVTEQSSLFPDVRKTDV